jgi:hypothetical protein
MRTSNHSDFQRWSGMLAKPTRTAVYGPVCTVVWQGSAGDRRPYADLVPFAEVYDMAFAGLIASNAAG